MDKPVVSIPNEGQFPPIKTYSLPDDPIERAKLAIEVINMANKEIKAGSYSDVSLIYSVLEIAFRVDCPSAKEAVTLRDIFLPR